MAQRKIRMARPSPQSKARLARELRRLRNRYGDEAETGKRRLLTLLADDPPHTAHALQHLHEDLLFMRAFPGDAATLRLVKSLLTRVGRWVAYLPRDERTRLHDTGIAGSATRHVYPFPIAQWLVRKAPGEADIDWRNYGDASLLDRALFAVMRPVELEAAESGEVSTRALFKAARRKDGPGDLDWIIGALSEAPATRRQADALWNEAEVPIVWNLSKSRRATTGNMLSGAPVVLRRAMRRPPENVASRILEPMTVDLLPRVRALKVIEAAQTALAARCREVLAISYPNPDEVHWCDLGEGAAIAVIGVAPEKRLNFETNTGYLLMSNGVPIGYGGVTPFFRQANTGINIFDPFRGSEAAFFWVEMLRAFHAIYGSTRFVVNGYQFGEGNSEAISSGAYWFYYRLGFRPDHATQRKLAAKEAARLKRKNAAPSEKSVLRALAKGDLILDTPGFDPADALDEKLLVKASLAAARILAGAPCDGRGAAEAFIARQAAARLGVATMEGWSREERAAFARLAPIAFIPEGVEYWPDDEKRKIVAMMRAKASPQERDFALAAGRCERFYRGLAAALKDAHV